MHIKGTVLQCMHQFLEFVNNLASYFLPTQFTFLSLCLFFFFSEKLSQVRQTRF